MEQRPDDRYDIFIYLVSAINKNIQRIRSEKATEDGIKTVNTMWLLQLRNEPDGLTASELAAKCLVDKSLVSRELVQMEKSGLVRFDIKLEDSKVIRKIFLTEKGGKLAAKYSGVALDIQSAIRQSHSEEEIAIFYKVLKTFADRIEEAANDSETPTK
jgi:DNA-binding MarR family transcriptional regulator